MHDNDWSIANVNFFVTAFWLSHYLFFSNVTIKVVQPIRVGITKVKLITGHKQTINSNHYGPNYKLVFNYQSTHSIRQRTGKKGNPQKQTIDSHSQKFCISTRKKTQAIYAEPIELKVFPTSLSNCCGRNNLKLSIVSFVEWKWTQINAIKTEHFGIRWEKVKTISMCGERPNDTSHTHQNLRPFLLHGSSH